MSREGKERVVRGKEKEKRERERGVLGRVWRCQVDERGWRDERRRERQTD